MLIILVIYKLSMLRVHYFSSVTTESLEPRILMIIHVVLIKSRPGTMLNSFYSHLHIHLAFCDDMKFGILVENYVQYFLQRQAGCFPTHTHTPTHTLLHACTHTHTHPNTVVGCVCVCACAYWKATSLSLYLHAHTHAHRNNASTHLSN